MGRTWVDMMLDLTPIDNEETSASGGNEVPGSKAELEGIFGTKGKGYMECLNSSFGSIEGFGEGGESESQEVSLELQVAGLQHQVRGCPHITSAAGGGGGGQANADDC